MPFQLLHQVSEFRQTRHDHVATLDRIGSKLEAVAKESSAFRERLRAADVSRFSDKILSVLGSKAVADIIQTEVHKSVNEGRTKVVFQVTTRHAVVYEEVWASLQSTIALTNVIAYLCERSSEKRCVRILYRKFYSDHFVNLLM